MRAIKISAYQNMASYRLPISFVIKESYPLPPYSTVIGMVHAACGFKEYVPMDVSVQGSGYYSVSDLYTKYEFSPGMSYDPARHQIEISEEKHSYGVTRGAGRVELIVDVQLSMHICLQDQNRTEEVLNGLKNPINYLSLGRWEDILRIDEVKEVSVIEQRLPDLFLLPQNAYVPIAIETKYGSEAEWNGTVYTLNKDYHIDPQTKARKWNKVRVRFANKKSYITEEEKLFLDSDGEPVFFA